MKTVCVFGSQGFVMGYTVRELLAHGYRVIGYDDYSKYGVVKRDYDNHPNFTLHVLDLAHNVPDITQYNPSYVIMGAALIGGIATFHKYALDLVMQNERIMANGYEAVLECATKPHVVIISSSMVFEGADQWYENLKGLFGYSEEEAYKETWPTAENAIDCLPRPRSTYGAQKLMCEYFAAGGWEQYQIPFTIIRPYNCVGLGEEKSVFDEVVMSGNVQLLMSHILPDLMHKCLSGQDPLRIMSNNGGQQVRCYTHGKDIARGIRLAMESPSGLNNHFNISTPRATTVRELAELVWNRVNPNKPFRFEQDEPFEHDVQRRIPDVTKAKELLGFEAQITLEESIDELYHHMKGQLELERIK